MGQTLVGANFFLYEIGFVLFALALGLQSGALRKLTRSLHLPAFWIFPAVSALLLVLCAALHAYVYLIVSPHYLLTGARGELLLMYGLKTASMVSILLAGGSLALGGGLYLRATR